MSSPSVDLMVATTTDACALSRTWRHISLSWVTVAGLRTPAKSLTQSVRFSEETGSAAASAAHATIARTIDRNFRRSHIAEDCTGMLKTAPLCRGPGCGAETE